MGLSKSQRGDILEKFIEDIQRQSWPTKLNELTKGGETIGMFTHIGELETSLWNRWARS